MGVVAIYGRQGHSRAIILTNYDGLESPMLHAKFVGNRPAGSGEDFWRVFTIYGGHLGHVTSIMSSNFHFLVPESFLTKFGSELRSSFWENPVLIFVCTRPWAKSLTFINSIRCLFLPTFRSRAAIVSEKSTVFTFSYEKAQVTIFDHAIK